MGIDETGGLHGVFWSKMPGSLRPWREAENSLSFLEIGAGLVPALIYRNHTRATARVAPTKIF
jgi:hypothetical protein